MIGNAIYLLFCRYIVSQDRAHETLQTPHATFDGAARHMDAIKEHYRSKNFRVEEVPDGSFYVSGPFGFKRLYYVATRTIEE